jgi:hypothetical protein
MSIEEQEFEDYKESILDVINEYITGGEYDK